MHINTENPDHQTDHQVVYDIYCGNIVDICDNGGSDLVNTQVCNARIFMVFA